MRKQAEDLLAKIVKEALKVDITALPEEAGKYPLLSERFGVEPFQMIHFLDRVEQEFRLRIPDEAIAEHGFNAFDDIVEIIIGCRLEE